jgi:hypothetical protein
MCVNMCMHGSRKKALWKRWWLLGAFFVPIVAPVVEGCVGVPAAVYHGHRQTAQPGHRSLPTHANIELHTFTHYIWQSGGLPPAKTPRLTLGVSLTGLVVDVRKIPPFPAYFHRPAAFDHSNINFCDVFYTFRTQTPTFAVISPGHQRTKPHQKPKASPHKGTLLPGVKHDHLKGELLKLHISRLAAGEQRRRAGTLRAPPPLTPSEELQHCLGTRPPVCR